MHIRIFVTGGTFDKEYDEIEEGLYFRDTHVPDMMKQGRTTVQYDVRTLMVIDSLDMTDADRRMIADSCAKAKEDEIIITHGTSTMAETAQFLGHEMAENAALQSKTIVLTGAMIPFKFQHSDSLFNLSSALAFVQVLHPGVYVAMNGRYFLWNNVRKNVKLGIFEELSS